MPNRLIFTGHSDFLPALRLRVDALLDGKPRRDDPRLHRKIAIILAGFAASYALALAGATPGLRLAGWVSFALSSCALGFNLFHDSIHGSLSESPGINLATARLACALLGAGRFFWHYKHNVLHHRFTNVFRFDDDLETRDSLRMSPRQPWKAKYRGQHLYFPFLYALTTLEWFFLKDFVHYFTGRINLYQAYPAMTRGEKVEFWTCKAVYFSLFVAPTFLLWPAKQAALDLTVFHLTLGLSLALIFNLAHAVDDTEFPEPEITDEARVDNEWAIHELQTTVNFAPGSRFLNWFAGGLNFQVEHHLFPQISHTHYPDIRPLVKQTAEEFGLPYLEHPTYLGALRSHVSLLRRLASGD